MSRQKIGEGQLVETSWRLDASDGTPICMVYCFYSPPEGKHAA